MGTAGCVKALLMAYECMCSCPIKKFYIMKTGSAVTHGKGKPEVLGVFSA